ncbi:MAG: hypothetical protein AAFQ43_02835 [Bacteroidota bacterium]
MLALVVVLFTCTSCSLTSGKKASQSTCESPQADGVWVGSDGSGDIECHCYTAQCCNLIGDSDNVECFL